jgi:hypothetical protein
MKHIKRALALFTLGMVGLLGLRTAEACGCRARDAAWAYCTLQNGYGIQCTVVQSDRGCSSDWFQAQVFSDGYFTYFACTHH